MSSRKKKAFNVKAELERELDTGNVRMKWYCINNSTNQVLISSYYCKFYHNDRPKGLYNPSQHEWRTKEVKLTSMHVRTLLHPEEERTYVWNWVQPEYYGILEEGDWLYELHLFYSVQGGDRLRVAKTKSNSIEYQPINTDSRSKMENNVIQLLKEEFPRIRGVSVDDLTRDVRSYMTSSKSPYVDMILRDDEHLFIVEIKNQATKETVRKVMRNVEDVAERIGAQIGLRTIGVIIGRRFTHGVDVLAMKNGIKILNL